MRRLFLTALILLIASTQALAAEPDDGTDDSVKPAAKTPVPEKKPAPKKTEYEKLPYATLLKKADAGNLNAQFELGSRYNYGRDLPKNTREALRWLRSAAQAGHTAAQRLLAIKLFEGHDVTVDYEEALKWAQRLADGGDRPGQLMLGNLYANGEGTPRNLILAYMWFDIAATPVTGKEPDEAAKAAMQSATEALDKTAGLLQPDEEVEAQQLASDWWISKHTPAPVTKKKKAGKPASKKVHPTKK